MSRELLAVSSDQHGNSTLGLCPPEGIQLDDGGRYMPSNAQVALWEKWLEYWDAVASEKKPGDKFVPILLGDLVDGDHHATSQIVSRNLPAVQHRLAMGILKPMLDLAPDAVILIRGTEAHVGGSAAFEERIAEEIGAIQDPETGAWSSWELDAIFGGVYIVGAHHGRMGARKWTKLTGVGTMAAEIVMSAAEAKCRIPDLAFFGHHHRWADSYDNFATRVIQLGGWQLGNAFVKKIAPLALPSLGSAIVTCESGRYEVQKVKVEWKRREPWFLSASSR